MASLDTIIFLFTHICTNNAYWQSDENITILCIYSTVISNMQICSWMCFLLAHCIIIRASWETKKKRLSYRKKYIEEFVWETSLFWLHTLVIFYRFFFFCLLPSPTQVTYLLNDNFEYIEILLKFVVLVECIAILFASENGMWGDLVPLFPQCLRPWNVNVY